jgi:hypothetical protein
MINPVNFFKACCLGVLSVALSTVTIATYAESNGSHLRLIDPLDRPEDGYCIDIVGTPRAMRLDLPVFAHNCKQGLTPDSAVNLDEQGRIVLVSPGVCLTVAGINSGALPGSAVLLANCDESSIFFETPRLQRFFHHEDGRLELVGSGLCLAVGVRSATTYSAADQWRPLFVDDCKTVESVRARWKFVKPAN